MKLLRALLGDYRGNVLYVVDTLAILGTLLAGYYIRFFGSLESFRPVSEIPPVAAYVSGACVLAGVWAFLIWRDGGYETSLMGGAAPFLPIRSLVLTGVQALVLLMAFSFAVRFPMSRAVYLLSWGSALLVMVGARRLIRAMDHALEARGIVLQRIVVLGSPQQAKDLAEQLKTTELPYRVTGIVQWNSVVQTAEEKEAPVPVLGDIGRISKVFAENPFQQLLIFMDKASFAPDIEHQETLIDALNFCEAQGIAVYMLPSILDITVTQSEVGSFLGLPIIQLRDAALHPFYGAVKRTMDICASTLILVLGMPFWLLIALRIKATDKGPAIFAQTRAGLHGKPFKMYKFRSMVEGAEDSLEDIIDVEKLDEPVFKIRNDPRVTPIGRFLRRTSLDEIPQFYNALIGDMSMVGPRPEELALVEKYTPWQRRRLKARPGITGLQQITNRGEPSLTSRVKYDLTYVKSQSFSLDLYIILKTLVVVVRGTGTTH